LIQGLDLIPRVTPRTDSRNSAIARIPNISNSINGQEGYQNISRDSTQRSRFSRVSQVTIYSTALSIMTWISNQWNNFISNMNGTASIPNELDHILSMIGTRATDEKRIIIHGLQIISVKNCEK